MPSSLKAGIGVPGGFSRERLSARVLAFGRIAVRGIDSSRGWDRRIQKARTATRYQLSFSDSLPLVSILITTHTSPDVLWTRALRSALEQDYPNKEVVIAIRRSNAEALDASRRRVAALDDPRVRIIEVDEPTVTFSGNHRKWLLAGLHELNAAFAAARGSWCVLVDHDDELVGDAVTRLLDKARADRLEFVYGDVLRASGGRAGQLICSDPPSPSQVAFQGSLWNSALRVIPLQWYDSLVGTPSDWGAISRMMRAHVRMGHLHHVTCHFYPGHFG